jgi:hypothetical protein
MDEFISPFEIRIDDPLVNYTCVFERPNWYCCKPYNWATIKNTTSGAEFEVRDCYRFKNMRHKVPRIFAKNS